MNLLVGWTAVVRDRRDDVTVDGHVELGLLAKLRESNFIPLVCNQFRSTRAGSTRDRNQPLCFKGLYVLAQDRRNFYSLEPSVQLRDDGEICAANADLARLCLELGVH